MSKDSKFKNSVLGMQGNLLSFALKLTLNNDEAKDLVQDTTLKALNNEEKYVDDNNFKGWMFTIMRNIFINNYNRTPRINTNIDVTDDLYSLNDAGGTVAETPESVVACREISEILSQFPDSYRRPFSMHVAGYKYEEIAERLNMPMGTVKCRIFFTRKRLREMLKDYR
ncbi:MAG: RNA polymerase sigma factor [Clostridium sp.]|nr:RNA polymerase sigma factor [Prevotella sp.]MCM1428426.1 RNA polymerase sigma factor [Clostridium sp.]MCM1474891.1 RNA polymerase sigma factor [Muribaculaceae bacterium]